MAIEKKGQKILSLTDWKELAPPKAEYHWKDNRSAKEVARAWLEGGGSALPEEVDAALSTHPAFGRVASWVAEPEARLPFDEFPGESRNTDLLVLATDSFGTYVLAVEAKSDEPYGETIGKAFAAALERRIENPRSNGVARIQQLADTLLQPRASGTYRATELRYQLLTACAGAVAEAKRRGWPRAVLLVHEFVTSETDDDKHARNDADLAAFIARLTRPAISVAVGSPLVGPFTFPTAPSVRLYVGKVVRNLRPRSTGPAAAS